MAAHGMCRHLAICQTLFTCIVSNLIELKNIQGKENTNGLFDRGEDLT